MIHDEAQRIANQDILLQDDVARSSRHHPDRVYDHNASALYSAGHQPIEQLGCFVACPVQV
jgi:hypothetical protein